MTTMNSKPPWMAMIYGIALASTNLVYIEGHFVQIGSLCTNQGSMMPSECLIEVQISKYTSSHVIR